MKELWDRLGRIRTSRLRVEDAGTTREGSGTVTIRRADHSVIDWEERGTWNDSTGHETSYQDRLRWALNAPAGPLSLFHLRQGDAHPVHLADLRSDGQGRLVPALPHLCADDRYVAEVSSNDDEIKVSWQVTGPKKGYSLERLYR